MCEFIKGVYLPLLWEKSFCWKSPIVLGYTRGHFSALVAMETEQHGAVGAGAHIDNSDETHVTYLPLVDHELKLLPVHFLNATEVRRFTRLIWIGALTFHNKLRDRVTRIAGKKSAGKRFL